MRAPFHSRDRVKLLKLRVASKQRIINQLLHDVAVHRMEKKLLEHAIATIRERCPHAGRRGRPPGKKEPS